MNDSSKELSNARDQIKLLTSDLRMERELSRNLTDQVSKGGADLIRLRAEREQLRVRVAGLEAHITANKRGPPMISLPTESVFSAGKNLLIVRRQDVVV